MNIFHHIQYSCICSNRTERFVLYHVIFINELNKYTSYHKRMFHYYVNNTMTPYCSLLEMLEDLFSWLQNQWLFSGKKNCDYELVKSSYGTPLTWTSESPVQTLKDQNLVCWSVHAYRNQKQQKNMICTSHSSTTSTDQRQISDAAKKRRLLVSYIPIAINFESRTCSMSTLSKMSTRHWKENVMLQRAWWLHDINLIIHQ